MPGSGRTGQEGMCVCVCERERERREREGEREREGVEEEEEEEQEEEGGKGHTCITELKKHVFPRLVKPCSGRKAIYVSVTDYRTVEKLGEGFNLAIWQFRAKPPN